MKHEIKYDEKDQIAVLIFNDTYRLEEVEPAFEVLKSVLEGKPYKQLLVTVGEEVKNSFQLENRETREAVAYGLANSDISNIAFVGGTAAIRMIAKVLLKTGIVKVNGDFFKTWEDGVNWLKSKR
jgi:hypothetical protein